MMRGVPRRLARTIRELAGHAVVDPVDALRAAAIAKLRYLILDENVVGFGIAEKQRDSEPTGELGITFFVREKRNPTRMAAATAIPALLADRQGRIIHTDVIEVGTVEAQAQVTASPIRSGFSVGHSRGAPGTVGAIVAKGGRPHVLSAQHVLADYDRAGPGDTIIYPARSDGGTAANTIGKLLAYGPLDRSPGYFNRVDAALCALTTAAAATVDPGIPVARTPLEIGDAVKGMRVTLSGRSSGQSSAVVRALMVQADIWHPPIGLVGFRDQIACDAFSQGGDSGSLVVDAADGRVIGLLIGGSSSISVVTPIRAVLSAVSAKLM